MAAPNLTLPLAQSAKAPFQYVQTLFISATFGIGIQTAPYAPNLPATLFGSIDLAASMFAG
jgi:hypothetical protein